MLKSPLFRRLFLPYFLVICVCVGLFGAWGARRLRSAHIIAAEQRLADNTLLIARLLDEPPGSAESLQTRIDELGRALHCRITVIAADGEVIADNEADAARMDNHRFRPEVAAALSQGRGISVRDSDTLRDGMVYFARRIESTGGAAVLRLSIHLRELDRELSALYRALAIAALLAISAAGTFSFHIARRHALPIVELTEFADSLARGDLAHRISGPASGEIAVLTSSLNSMADEIGKLLSQSRRYDEMRKEFVANVSHELRTPIAAIKGYAETLRGGALDDAEKARQYLAIIEKHADQLTNLVSDLLDLARLESQTPSPPNAPVDLAAVVRRAVEMHAPVAAQKRQNLSLRITPNMPNLHGDGDQLERAVANLLDNAIKYTPSDGVIDVTLSTGDDRAIIQVRDNGMGIPADDLPRIFERFYRVDRSRSRALGGTGLGLSIVKHVAQSHGGEVAVASTLGAGSAFTLRLPLAR